MHLRITRTSLVYGDTEPPCAEATGDPEAWYIDLRSLEDLIALSERLGPIIVFAGDDGPSLEIYDDYRE
jgi:hypothetical protein